jgi:hypothetical protein
MARDSIRQAIKCWRCASFGYSRYSNVRMLYLYRIEHARIKGVVLVSVSLVPLRATGLSPP